MKREQEQGFVLATSLVMLLLMTLLSVAMYVSVDSSQKSSRAAESTTQAFYYAETAANYMGWALYNNAEFDSYTYPQSVGTDPVTGNAVYSFLEPDTRATSLPDPLAAGDLDEWKANRGNPSGEQWLTLADNPPKPALPAPGDYYGQLMYYDNDPYANRVVFLKGSVMNPNSFGEPVLPELHKIHKKLPRYIVLSIDDYGNITPSMPPYSSTSPHHGDELGIDYPENGAIVWVTGGNRTDDLEIDPTDHDFAHIFDYTNPFDVGTIVYDRYGQYPYDVLAHYPFESPATLACDPHTADQYSIACNKITRTWLKDNEYGLVIYSVGYVHGRANKLIRVVYR